MTLFAALALLPFAAIANFALVVALANQFDDDRPAAGFPRRGPDPRLSCVQPASRG